MKIGDALLERNLLQDYFSYSKLSTYSKCPYKAFLRYIQGKREHGAYLLKGRAVHKGQEEDNRAKLRGQVLPAASILERAVAELEAEGSRFGITLDKDAFVSEHAAQLEIFRETGERDRIRPVEGSIEAPFEVHLRVAEEKAVLQGFVDVLSYGADNTSQHPVDYKAVQRPLSQADVDSSMQFEIYRWGAGRRPCQSPSGQGTAGAAGSGVEASSDGAAEIAPPHIAQRVPDQRPEGLDGAGAALALQVKCVSFVGAISGKRRQKPTARVVVGTPATVERAERTMLWVGRTIREFRRSLKSGDWPRCAPESFWCSAGSCDFYSHCYPKYEPGQARLVEVESIRPVGSMPQPEWRK